MMCDEPAVSEVNRNNLGSFSKSAKSIAAATLDDAGQARSSFLRHTQEAAQSVRERCVYNLHLAVKRMAEVMSVKLSGIARPAWRDARGIRER